MRYFFLASFILVTQFVLAQNDNENRDTLVSKLRVAFKETPPFIIKTTDGSYEGVSIELWERIAKRLDLVYDYVEFETDNFSALLAATENGDVDLTISPLTVTSQRLKRFNFTQPFYSSSLAIVVKSQAGNPLWVFIKRLFSREFISVVTLLFSVILLFGLLLWLVEKRKNPDEFRGGIRGLMDGFWWSAVTMTTVGYGDKSPKTFVGRIIAVVWMFTAVIIISGFTGSIAASLTTSELNSDIKNLNDLQKIKVGTMKGSGGESFLLKNNISINSNDYRSINDALHELNRGNIDAFVYDEPILQYLLKSEDLLDELVILPNTFNYDYYSFGIPANSNLDELINPVLLEELENIRWLSLLNNYNLKKK